MMCRSLLRNFSRCPSTRLSGFWKNQLLRNRLAQSFQYSQSDLHSGQCCFAKKKPFHDQDRIITTKERPFFAKIHNAKLNLEQRFQNYLTMISMKKLVDKTPDSVKPYLQLARVDRPIGTILLYFPCVYGIALATPWGELPSLYYLGLFGLGAFLMRGSGCVINDLWDQDFDKRVERTKERPIASGQISQKQAIVFLAAQLSAALAILLSLNTTCIVIGFAAMIPVVLYPLAKRVTMVPQAVLGLTMNIGALMGYAAVSPTLDWITMSTLYASCFMWTLYYDTVYAFQDVDDDKKIGVKSITMLFEKYADSEKGQMITIKRLEEHRRQERRILWFLMATAYSHLFLLGVSGYQNYLEGPLFLAIIIATIKASCDILEVKTYDHSTCWKAFNHNRYIAYILAAGIISSVYLLPKAKPHQKTDNKVV